MGAPTLTKMRPVLSNTNCLSGCDAFVDHAAVRQRDLAAGQVPDDGLDGSPSDSTPADRSGRWSPRWRRRPCRPGRSRAQTESRACRSGTESACPARRRGSSSSSRPWPGLQPPMSATTNRRGPASGRSIAERSGRSSSLATRPARSPAFMSIWTLGKTRSPLPAGFRSDRVAALPHRSDASRADKPKQRPPRRRHPRTSFGVHAWNVR